jgi:hypothetical protein
VTDSVKSENVLGYLSYLNEVYNTFLTVKIFSIYFAVNISFKQWSALYALIFNFVVGCAIKEFKGS